ncbi:peptidoglycan DD-metalloendopeptidase family protein [Buchnera aphidicola]|uniref:peptidoglycan DD-metalloendopeptidase family protein n=1 Tax=Buchnera aphidicola TaxID=9 RepID=UPI003463DCD2
MNISNKNFFGIFQEDRFKMFYVVKPKDTLYSIAKKSGHSYYELSKVNFIKKPYKIMIGQKIWIGDFLINEIKNNCFIINLNKNDKKKYTACQTIFNKKFEASSFFKKYIQYKTSKICLFCNKIVNNKKYFNSDKKWDWPIKSKHIRYEYDDKSTNKEIEFFGFKGQPVFAAASGKVVFITDMFKKYGRLIILKHNQNYHSIYAFNDMILVKQEEKVSINQQISTMGLSQKKTAQLYFEIRYKGKSINPLNVLSKNDIKE